MNVALLRQLMRRGRIRLAALCVGATLWGLLAPVVFASLLTAFKNLDLPTQITHFGSGSLTTLTGTITIFYEHPLVVAMLATIAVGFCSGSIAGARQRGTLEMWLARPVTRRSVLITTWVAAALMLSLIIVGLIAGTLIGAALEGHSSDVPVTALPLTFLNALLLYASFGAFAVAASVMNNRAAPAMSLSIAYVLVNYFVEVLGSMWPDAASFQKYSLFHHFQAGVILDGNPAWSDFALLAGTLVVPLIFAFVMFPRRDLAAPG